MYRRPEFRSQLWLRNVPKARISPLSYGSEIHRMTPGTLFDASRCYQMLVAIKHQVTAKEYPMKAVLKSHPSRLVRCIMLAKHNHRAGTLLYAVAYWDQYRKIEIP